MVKSFDYHLVSGVQNGALSSVRDGNGNVTTYNDYRMGVPRDITFQDGHSLRTEIDANGWPLSRRDETLQLTQYRYDVLGRLKEIDVDGPWNSTIFSFNKLAASGAPYGLNSHWLRTTQIGGMRTDVYLDALLRPVRTEKVDLSAQLPRRVTLSRFDVMNRRNFESYPVSGLAIPTGNEEGSFWTFDALNRERTISQDRENNAPAAVTSIDYLTGFRKRVTNPRGFVTEYEFQAFADPDQALPIRISAPEGQTTVISRDDFGNATSISRTSVYGGTPYTLTRSFVYDSSQRLCKRIEPETGVSVFSYDSAGNLDWSAHGLS